tara:strand:+ start:14 stop:412 length:399 start_codon:yes stop_codon:yes gene_type:complete
LSEIRATTISDAAGTGPVTLTKQSAAKAWVNFDGATADATTNLTGVRDSLNVSSLVDVSSGKYKININNNMANSNYILQCTHTTSSGGRSDLIPFIDNGTNVMAAGSFGVLCVSSVFDDTPIACSTIHGDLA